MLYALFALFVAPSPCAMSFHIHGTLCRRRRHRRHRRRRHFRRRVRFRRRRRRRHCPLSAAAF